VTLAPPIWPARSMTRTCWPIGKPSLRRNCYRRPPRPNGTPVIGTKATIAGLMAGFRTHRQAERVEAAVAPARITFDDGATRERT
jgi:hypothetical protein